MLAAVTGDRPRPISLPTMNVTVQCVRRNQIETHHQTIATDDHAVRRLVNYFEDEVGVVLSVEHEDGRTLFRSGFEAWEAMQ